MDYSQNLSILSPDLNVMLQACLKVERFLVRDFGELEHLQSSPKNLINFVMKSEKKIQKEIYTILQKARPNHGFVFEDHDEIKGNNEFRWIIDPLDGTTNFMRAIPRFAVSIALEKEHKIIAGMVYDPIAKNLYYAIEHSGAFLNNKRIRIANQKNLSSSSIGISFPHSKIIEPSFFQKLESLNKNSFSIRKSGSAALDLCYVATGQYDGYWGVDLQYWDIASGSIIIKEAGGHITNMQQKESFYNSKGCYAGNFDIHEQIGKI